MATVTPNFNWPVPTSVDLVKDGAVAIEALGDAVDASLLDLKGGTTGQVLSKTSNTDMDFTWVAADDTNAIQNAIVDAKGDLIAASAADTPARLAAGNNGETLVVDSSTATGLRYQGNFAAGKNKIINGDFGIWQRGTSFAALASDSYTADRYQVAVNGTSAVTVSRQNFTAGTAPVAGYESPFFYRYAVTSIGTGVDGSVNQKIEDVRTFAGQTVAFSFWAKADSARTVYGYLNQNFGSGGSGTVATLAVTASVTTSWTRFSGTVTLPSISGKTIGTNSFLLSQLYFPTATGFSLDIWGVQLEAGSVATVFQTATGTIQGELAACQRYYYRNTPGSAAGTFNNGGAGFSTTLAICSIKFPVTMRVKPTSMDFAGLEIVDYVNAAAAVTSAAIGDGFTTDLTTVNFSVASGLTQFRPYWVRVGSAGTGYLGFSAEL